MSLRDRLTLLNVILLGGLFIFFGVVAYVVTSVLLYSQIDSALESTAEKVVAVARVDTSGSMEELNLPEVSLASNVYIEVRSVDNKLVRSYPQLAVLEAPFDEIGMRTTLPVYRDVVFSGIRLRVLSVPLELEGRPIGMIQVAANLDVVDSARRTLLSVLAGPWGSSWLL